MKYFIIVILLSNKFGWFKVDLMKLKLDMVLIFNERVIMYI